jgi:DNA-binding CsgD family transcriptional regulator
VAVSAAPLVERERELAAFERLLARARAGEGGTILVEGPPGIGKSSLLAATRASATDFRVLTARASELERDFPFGIVRQLLEPLLATAGDEERAALLAGAGGLAEPVLAQVEPELTSEPTLPALHGLYWLTANAAAQQPLLVLVDDAHWADDASLRWLVYLARRLDGMQLALAVAARSEEGDDLEGLLRELSALSREDVLRLAPLTPDAVSQVIEASLSSAADPAFVAACHRATGGNGFLLRELLGELGRRGIEPTAQNARFASSLSSIDVSRALRARLRRLTPECAALARAVAILGDRAEPAPAAQLAGLDDATAARAADELADATILEPGRPLSFVHPVVRSSIEAGLSAAERAVEHERAARVLAEAGASEERVAVHLLASHPRGDDDTVATLRRAAATAGRRGAPEVAARYLRRALEEPPADELMPVIAHELGPALVRSGDLDGGIEQLHAATRGLPDHQARGQAANALGLAMALARRPDDGVAKLTAVIDGLPESERELGLRLQAARWVVARGSVNAWRELRVSGDHFTLAEATADTPGERLQLGVASFDAAREGTATEAKELALRALGDGRLIDDPGPEAAGFWLAPSVLLAADALEEAITLCDAVIEWAKRRGSVLIFSMAGQLRAYAGWHRGALADAEADARSALEEAAPPGFPPYGYVGLVNVLLARGAVAEAEATLPPALPDPGSTRALFYFQVRARLRAAAQRPTEALDDLFTCGRLEEALEIRTPAFSGWRADAVPLLAALKRREDAGRLAQEELERCRAFGAASQLSAALRALAQIERADSIELLEQALEVLRPGPPRLERMLVLVELGAALRRAGRRSAAREPLGEALDLATRCGATIVAARAHDELVAAGARPRRDPIESRSNLTASELRVARMAAEGMTNREIAQALFLTEKTIENHLRSVFRKLDIGSRSQLARTLPA